MFQETNWHFKDISKTNFGIVMQFAFKVFLNYAENLSKASLLPGSDWFTYNSPNEREPGGGSPCAHAQLAAGNRGACSFRLTVIF